jgi:hypothetical protein
MRSGISPGVKVAGAYDWRPTTLVVPNVEMIWSLNLPRTPRATSPCRGISLLYFLPSQHLYAFMSCMRTILLCTFFNGQFLCTIFYVHKSSEICNLPWDSDCTQFIQVNIFLSFFLLIFSIFVTHGYFYLSLMMSTMCSFEALHYKSEGSGINSWWCH